MEYTLQSNYLHYILYYMLVLFYLSKPIQQK
nr:MAG TPA: hypothetical protein [Bacteriophage sp.]DAM00287.1 MAG TPA: hypothetical protein [Caudoviricetes sp.]